MKPVNTSRDFLTNCYTREGILPFLKRLEEDYATNQRPFSVLILDVDHFKSFNDKYGHLYGDEVLKYFSSSMRLDLEDEENAPFRFGGDEFIMVFPVKTSGEAYVLAERLKKNIRTRSCLIKGHQLSVTFSGGIATYPQDAQNIDDILEKADKALYSSKSRGRNRTTQFRDLAHRETMQYVMAFGILVVIGGLLFLFRSTVFEQINKLESFVAERTKPFFSSKVSEPKEEDRSENPMKALFPNNPYSADAISRAGSSGVAATPRESTPIAVVPTLPLGPRKTKLYLDTGRTVEGMVLSETEDIIKVELTLNQGKAILNIKKSQVLKREFSAEEPASS